MIFKTTVTVYILERVRVVYTYEHIVFVLCV